MAAMFWAALFMTVTQVWSQVVMYGHHNVSEPEGTLSDSAVNTLVVPDMYQTFTYAGKLLNLSFNALGSQGVVQVVILSETSPGSGRVKVSQITDWATGDTYYTTRFYHGIPGWSNIIFNQGYIPVKEGQFIGLLFKNQNRMTYTTPADCTDFSPYQSYTLPPSGDLYQGRVITLTEDTQCRRYDYLVPHLRDDTCINVRLAYYFLDNGDIGGYNIVNLEQTLMGRDSVCWWIVAPPRPDGKEAVVELYAQELPEGYEVAESGNAGDKPSYCVYSGLRVEDGGTGEFLDSVCQDSSLEQKNVYSKTNSMMIKFYAGQKARFKGQVNAGLKSYAKYPNYGGGSKLGVIVGASVGGVVLLVILIGVGICVCKQKPASPTSGTTAGRSEGTTAASRVQEPKASPMVSPADKPTGHPSPAPQAYPRQPSAAPQAYPTGPAGYGYGPPPAGYGQPSAPPNPAYGAAHLPPFPGYQPSTGYPLSSGSQLPPIESSNPQGQYPPPGVQNYGGAPAPSQGYPSPGPPGPAPYDPDNPYSSAVPPPPAYNELFNGNPRN